MTRSDRMRLADILEAIRDINAHTASGRRAFDADRMAQQAVMHCLTVIGEATSRLTSTTLAYIPSLNTPGPVGLRNLVVHEYWRIDLDEIWATIKDDLPRLSEDVQRFASPADRGTAEDFDP